MSSSQHVATTTATKTGSWPLLLFGAPKSDLEAAATTKRTNLGRRPVETVAESHSSSSEDFDSSLMALVAAGAVRTAIGQ